MKKELAIAAFLALVSNRAGAQQPEPQQVFDVASVKPNPEPAGPGTMMRELPGSITYRKMPLLAVIRRAYNVQTMQIAGPSWLSAEAYDIEAKLPSHTPDDRIQLMLQRLLAERFQLRVHHEKKRLTGYVLVVGRRGIRIHRSENGRLGWDPSRDGSGVHLRGKITMPILANYLSGEAHRPILDRTGLEGLYDIDLNYSTDEARSADASTAPGIFTALDEQLGLKLESTKALFDMVIVDHVEKVPAGN